MTEERCKIPKLSVKDRAREINKFEVAIISSETGTSGLNSVCIVNNLTNSDESQTREVYYQKENRERQSGLLIKKTNRDVLEENLAELRGKEEELGGKKTRKKEDTVGISLPLGDPGTSYTGSRGEVEYSTGSGKRSLPPTASSSSSQPPAPAGKSPIEGGREERNRVKDEAREEKGGESGGVTRSVFRTKGEERTKITSDDERRDREKEIVSKDVVEEGKFSSVRKDALSAGYGLKSKRKGVVPASKEIPVSSPRKNNNNQPGNVLRKIAAFEASKYVSRLPPNLGLNELRRKDSLPVSRIGRERATSLRARSASVDSPSNRRDLAKCNGSKKAPFSVPPAKAPVVLNGTLKKKVGTVSDTGQGSSSSGGSVREFSDEDYLSASGSSLTTYRSTAVLNLDSGASEDSTKLCKEDGGNGSICQKVEKEDGESEQRRKEEESFRLDDIIDSLEKIRDQFDEEETSWAYFVERSGSDSLTNSVSSPVSEDRLSFRDQVASPSTSEKSSRQSDECNVDKDLSRCGRHNRDETRLVVSGFDALSNSFGETDENDEILREERLNRKMDRRLTGNRFRAYSNYATAPSNPVIQNNGYHHGNRQPDTRLVPNLSIKAITKVPPPAILYHPNHGQSEFPEEEAILFQDDGYRYYEDDDRYYGEGSGTLGYQHSNPPRLNYGRSLVRAKPQLPAYLTLGRGGARSNNNRDQYDDPNQRALVLREENELEKIREILSGLDFSKYRKRPVNRSTSDCPSTDKEIGGVQKQGSIRRSLSSQYPLSQPSIERSGPRKTTYNHNNIREEPISNPDYSGGGWGTNRLKELTRKLKPQMVSTAPSSPNLGLPKPTSPFSKKSPVAKRSFSYSNFETVPRQGSASNPGSPQTFRQRLQQNSLVRATATLPRRKAGIGEQNSTSPYSLLATGKEQPHCADYLDLETGPRHARPYTTSLMETASNNRPKFELGSPDSVVETAGERYSHSESQTSSVPASSGASTWSLLRRSRINNQDNDDRQESTVASVPDTPPGVPERRKRRKALGLGPTVGFQVTDRNYAKSDTGRSLTYPLQNQISAASKEVGDYENSRFSSRAYGRRPASDISVGVSGDVYAESFKSDALEEQMSKEANEGSVDDRNKSLKKKHHSDPGGEKPQLARVSGSSLSEIMAGSKSEPYLGDYSLEGEDSLEADEHDSLRSLGKARVTGSQTLPRRETPSRSLSVGGTWTRGSHRRYGSDGGGPQTPTAFYPKFAGDSESDSKSPQQQRRYYKKRLRGPYGEMLEEEMRKYGEKQKNPLSEEITSGSPDSLRDSTLAIEEEVLRHRTLPSGQSVEDPEQLKRSNSSPGGATGDKTKVLAKRKVSANLPFLGSSSSTSGSGTGSRSTTGASLLSLPGTAVVATSSEPILVRQASTESAGSTTSGTSGQLSRWSGGEDKSQEESWRVLDAEKYSDTRTHVVGELYDTEHSYVESLQILVNKYMKPLKSSESANLVDSSLVDEIFYQIPEILNHHESFLDLLRLRLSAWDTKQKIGDVFVEAFTKQPIVDTYTAFINNWKSAKEAIKLAVQAKPAFAKFLEHMSREHKGKLTLDALLIMPVQRIPRYELLIKELLKHTQLDHPDHQLLVMAQKEVHELAVKINRVEREAYQHEQMQQRVKDIEHLIEGVMDLVQPDRTFNRFDIVAIPGGLGTKKERCFFLFSDLLLITSIKRKSGTIRKSSSTLATQSQYGTMEMNKYKLLMRFSLDNLDIAKCTDSSVKKIVKEIENLEEDLSSLGQISDIASSLHCNHQSLDEVVRDMIGTVNKHLIDKQTNDAQLLSLDLTVTTQEGIDNLTIIFPTAEKRASWEESFNEAKQKLALSTDRRPPPEFMYPLPIRKTRAGLQFTCSASTLGLNTFGLKDVWVCNSDGYVGQVCVLSLQPEPSLTSCNGVCNARILCAMSIPAAVPYYVSSRRKSLIPDNVPVSISIHIEDADIEEEEEDSREPRASNGNFQLDSESSEDDEESVESPIGDSDAQKGNNSDGGSKDDREEMDNTQPTMWLGTEDGCIHVYNCNDNIRIKKNKMKIQHSAAVHCIIHLDNRVFVSLANGELVIYKKDTEGGWNTNDFQRVQVGTSSTPVLRMLPVAGKLWCGCQNYIKVLNTSTLEIEKSFQVCSDSSRPVICMVTSGLGVWIGIQHSAILRLFHATSYENLLEVNVAPAVTKMLSGCDNIIRQHKAACLRVTALLACKDLLWVGTSAGVILTLPLPHLTSNTTRLDYVPNVAGVPHGHTGHVRFMTYVEMSSGANSGCSKMSHRSVRSKEGLAARRASTVASSASSGCRLLVISGGDGYEDFRNLHASLNEGAGHDDSTNHLLLWQV